jgi:hypothetical protein
MCCLMRTTKLVSVITVGHEEYKGNNVANLSDISCGGGIQVIWQSALAKIMLNQIYVSEGKRKV